MMHHALNKLRGIQLGRGCWATDLGWADNTVVLGKKSGTVQLFLDGIAREAMAAGL